MTTASKNWSLSQLTTTTERVRLPIVAKSVTGEIAQNQGPLRNFFIADAINSRFAGICGSFRH
jgi:hypothetical protein